MTVDSLARELKLGALSLPHPEKQITGAYIGDLLSWVMGNAESGNLWITIMSNINIVAVATLVDVSCIILAEGVTLDNDVLELANNKGVNILSTKLTAYEIALRVSGIIQ